VTASSTTSERKRRQKRGKKTSGGQACVIWDLRTSVAPGMKGPEVRGDRRGIRQEQVILRPVQSPRKKKPNSRNKKAEGKEKGGTAERGICCLLEPRSAEPALMRIKGESFWETRKQEGSESRFLSISSTFEGDHRPAPLGQGGPLRGL